MTARWPLMIVIVIPVLVMGAFLWASSTKVPVGIAETTELEFIDELSGIAWHPRRGSFFGVGDEGRVAEFSRTGEILQSRDLDRDLEDIDIFADGKTMLLIDEATSELLELDCSNLATLRVVGVDPVARAGRNKGYEALDIVEKDGADDRVFLVNEKDPTMLVEVAWPSGETLGRTALEIESVSAIRAVGAGDRFLVLARSHGLGLIDRSGSRLGKWGAIDDYWLEGLELEVGGPVWISVDRVPSRLLRLEVTAEELVRLLLDP